MNAHHFRVFFVSKKQQYQERIALATKLRLENLAIQSGLKMHIFWGKKKHVQLKIVQHKVSVMLYSVQAFKIRASLHCKYLSAV